jgi:enamine deaminase RidA (YjgF/YER057c/UK114 family)
MNGRVTQRLTELQLVLPPPPSPVANYVPYVREGRFVQVAGVAPIERGSYTVVGKVGRELGLPEGLRAARLCALNLLATLKSACAGDLDRVTRVLMVRGFVNATEDFEDVPLVIDGLQISLSKSLVPTWGAMPVPRSAALPSRAALQWNLTPW